jgi:sigma-B regulation protein RsbU (phosphoserine phosphatase)
MLEQLELAVYHKQMTEVGGDYYDFFRTRDGHYAIGVFDISGHGVSAALIMAFLKAQFMQTMEQVERPKDIVEWVNNASLAFLREVRRYATVNFVVFDERRSATFAAEDTASSCVAARSTPSARATRSSG